jgi:NAD+ diphosphatase
MTFVNDFRTPRVTRDEALWFLFHEQRLLVKEGQGDFSVPHLSDLKNLIEVPPQPQFLGFLDDQPCYVGQLKDSDQLPEPFTWVRLMTLLERASEDMIRAAGMANQLLHWDQNHRFCGRCGNPTEDKTDERAKSCPQCGLINYPRLSPAVIVAVCKGHQILLAHSKRFPSGFYSVLAGFVEPGETLEECVRREVREEAGIEVKNIRYFGSQPWPFPDSFMLGFTAEYAGGIIRIDETEIDDAGWFSADNLPVLPLKISIARKLINWFLEERRLATP